MLSGQIVFKVESPSRQPHTVCVCARTHTYTHTSFFLQSKRNGAFISISRSDTHTCTALDLPLTRGEHIADVRIHAHMHIHTNLYTQGIFYHGQHMIYGSKLVFCNQIFIDHFPSSTRHRCCCYTCQTLHFSGGDMEFTGTAVACKSLTVNSNSL